MKLTNNMKEQIRDSFLKAIFTPKRAAIEVEERTLGDAVFRSIASEKDRKRWDDGPAGDFAAIRCKKTQFAEGHMTTVHLSEPVKMSFALENAYCWLCEDQALRARHLDWQSRKDAIESECHELRRKIMAALSSVNTDKQLLEVWPECAPFIPASSVNLPAVIVTEVRDEINKAMGAA